MIVVLFPSARAQAQGTPDIYLARVYRDEIGVAHVWGDRDKDVAYGIGRLVTRDKPLRTILAVTLAAGKAAESLGAHGQGADFHWIYVDRKAHAYQVPERAASLWASYFQPGASQDEIAIRDLVVAYVEGIRDEILTRTPEALADAYVVLSARSDWPYGEEFKLSRDQYIRLFSRAYGIGDYKIEYWEPFAADLYWLGRVQDALGDDPGMLDQPDALKDFFGFGSNSWGVTTLATQNGFGYLQADSHNPPYYGHTIRFASRLQGQKLDGGGVTWEGLGPFLVNGAFTANCGWTTMLFECDDVDTYKFQARYANGKYQCNAGSAQSPEWKDLTPQNLPLRYYDFGQGSLATITKTVYYVPPTFSASSLAILWAADPENDGWSPQNPPAQIRVARMSSLDPGKPGDPPVDMAKTLYKMLTATSAEEIVDSAFGPHPWTWPLNFTMGSGISGSVGTMQLICVPSGRVPFRYKEYPVQSTVQYFWNYAFGDIDYQATPDADWIVDSTLGVMFHPLAHFPIVKAHVRPSPQDPIAKFMANCNTSPQWVFGRNTPFPGKDPQEENLATGYVVNPRYRIKFNSVDYQVNPLFTGWRDYTTRWLTQTHDNGGVSPSITLSYGDPPLPNAFGRHNLRQEWVINRLERLYEGTGQTVRRISEQDMKDLILSRIDSAAWYFKEMKEGSPPKDWFQTARDYLDSLNLPEEQQVLALMDELHGWATTTGADLSVETGTYRQTPLKWHIFWYYFRERDDTPLNAIAYYLYGGPYHFYWPHATTTLDEYKHNGKYVHQEALREAAVRTVERMAGIDADYLLRNMLEVAIPFTSVTLETVGSWHSLKKLTYLGWQPGWETSPTPRRNVGFAGRLPLLIRFRKGSGAANDRKAWVMNNNIVSDLVNVLPEWQGAGRQRYEGSFRKMAAGELYDWPLTETDSRLTYIDDVTNQPPIEMNLRKRGKK